MQCERKCEGVRRIEAQSTLTAQSVISGSDSAIGCVVIGLTPMRKRSAATCGRGDPRGTGDRTRMPVSFSRLRAFCSELGVRDTFLWTSLCKCERIRGEKLPRETMETCARTLLVKELESIQKSVPIVALGNRVFDTIRRCFPDRFVLNVPSPDRSSGDFQKTIGNRRLMNLARRKVAANKPGAMCLCPPCARKYFGGDAVS